MKGDPLVQSKKFENKSHGAEKKWGKLRGIRSVVSKFCFVFSFPFGQASEVRLF